MNRTWLITIGIIIVVLIAIGIMHENGMLNFEWQGLTMLFAGLAAPYTLLKRFLIKDPQTQRLIDKHEDMKKDEKVHREVYDEEIAKKENRIKELNKELELTEKRIEIIELKKKKVKKEVKELSIDEMQEEAIDYFGS